MILAVMNTTSTVAREMPEWDSNPDLCDASTVLLPVKLQGELGAGHDVGL